KYTPAGGSVEVSVSRGPDGVAVLVEDPGIGIAPEDAARVFEPFVRLDAARSRDTGGSGLGLAIARGIAEAHGGSIELEPRPGGGSRFLLRLPA
ncbi:MAG: sensor histidine kinase, partial [Candidatus Rokubacteria bacterium]|nr:sensor histidine kinase [Candidatus Rokubacteria bacterium]